MPGTVGRLPFSMPLRQAVEQGAADLSSPQGLMALDGLVDRQAATLACLQDFRLMMGVTLAALPLLLLLRPGAAKGAPTAAPVIDR